MGRSSLILVMGFSIMLMMIGTNISKVSSSAMENYTYYNNSTMAHSIAGAGMNMACRSLYENPIWNAGFSNKEFAGGKFTVTVVSLGSNLLRVTSIGTFFGTTRVVSCVLQPSSFSRYNYYSVTDQNGYWISGDTLWGPFHCNNFLNVAGTPVFMQRATSLNGINNYQGQAHPVFKGGYDKGVSVSLPVNLNPLQSAAQTGGKYFTGAGGDVFMQFNDDGTVTWRQGGAADWTGLGWTTTSLTSFAPNGAVYLLGANIRIKGTIKGKLTVGVGGITGNTAQGNMWLDDDIKYKNDPRLGSSSDMLGLVAENKLWITDNTFNRGPNNDFTLMASVFSRTDGLWAQNYGSRPIEGRLITVGGTIQNIGGYTGVFSNGTNPAVINGFKPGGSYYDDRLMNDAPPFFPTTGQFEVVSWFE